MASKLLKENSWLGGECAKRGWEDATLLLVADIYNTLGYDEKSERFQEFWTGLKDYTSPCTARRLDLALLAFLRRA